MTAAERRPVIKPVSYAPIVTAIVCAIGSALLSGCGGPGPQQAASPNAGARQTTSAYCAQVRSMRPTPGMPFAAEATIVRNAAPLAPPALRDDFTTVMLAYEQVQDREDGTISADQETLVGTKRLDDALTAIDTYTASVCDADLGVALPSAPGG